MRPACRAPRLTLPPPPHLYGGPPQAPYPSPPGACNGPTRNKFSSFACTAENAPGRRAWEGAPGNATDAIDQRAINWHRAARKATRQTASPEKNACAFPRTGRQRLVFTRAAFWPLCRKAVGGAEAGREKGPRAPRVSTNHRARSILLPPCPVQSGRCGPAFAMDLGAGPWHCVLRFGEDMRFAGARVCF